MKTIAKSKSLEYKVGFNDYCMREMGFDIDEHNHLYDMETNTLLQIKEKFIAYNDEDVYPYLQYNEIDLNLIENYRLFETLFQVYITNYARSHNMDVRSFSLSKMKGTKKGKFTVSYMNNGEIVNIESDPYENESVRIFNLICKLNHRTHLYDFEAFDIFIEKDKERKR
jgi:hypothetical protein